MDWSFLNIFKRADFNTLMFSLAVTGWILLYYHPDIIYFKIVAILCSIYCICRLIAHMYNAYQIRKVKKANAKYDQDQIEEKLREKELQAKFVFDRLSSENQEILFEIVRKGMKSSYSNVYIFKDKFSNFTFHQQIDAMLLRDDMINSWISINETYDSFSVYIKSPLNSIIESKTNKVYEQ